MPGTNTLAYYEKAQLMAVKSFIRLTPGVVVVVAVAVAADVAGRNVACRTLHNEESWTSISNGLKKLEMS